MTGGLEPVRIHEFERQAAARSYMEGSPPQPSRGAEDARGNHDQAEPPVEVEVLDPGLNQLQIGQPIVKALQHPRVRIHPNQLDASAGKRHRDPSSADAKIENRRCGLLGPPQPGLRISHVRQLRVELGEAFVGIVRVVEDEARTGYTGKTPCLRLTRERVRVAYSAKRAASSVRKSEGATTASMTRLEASLYKSISSRYSSCSRWT